MGGIGLEFHEDAFSSRCLLCRRDTCEMFDDFLQEHEKVTVWCTAMLIENKAIEEQTHDNVEAHLLEPAVCLSYTVVCGYQLIFDVDSSHFLVVFLNCRWLFYGYRLSTRFSSLFFNFRCIVCTGQEEHILLVDEFDCDDIVFF